LVSDYKWTYKNKKIDRIVFDEIKNVTGSGIVASLLINRGVTCPKKAKEFLNPDDIEISSPYVFADMEKAVSRINKAIDKQEYIVIYGDFDADGVTSTSLLHKTLTFLGANVGYYIPDRIEEGHGLNSKALCELISKQKTKLLITVDCGIGNISEIKMAQSLGADVIITDHHEAPEELPPAFAIIDPKILDEDATGLKHLAGVGVAFKLAVSLLEKAGKQEFTEEILHLVAIGTIGDVVPLLGENRALVHKGLELISRKKPASIAKLFALSGYKPNKKISGSMVAFGIVPKINAIGRLSKAKNAVEFLISDDNAEKIDLLAEELNMNNKERQQVCENTFRDAEERIKFEVNLDTDQAIILADPAWHPGIVGIVASKFVEKYYRPTLLFSIDEKARVARCSARSIAGLNLFETISAFSEYFIRFGGHALAAGFSFSLDKISFEEMRKLLLAHINKVIGSETLTPEIKLDMDIESSDLTTEFIKELDRLAPYGESNPYPVFGIRNLALRSCSPLGAKKKHLRLMLSGKENIPVEAVWWQKSNLDIDILETVDVAFTPSINNFQNQEKVQLTIKDVRRNSEGNSNVPTETTTCEIDEKAILEGITPVFGEEETSDINWVDCRQETGLKKDFLEYLQSQSDKVGIFAESLRSFEILGNISFLNPLAFGRLGVKKVDTLVFLDFPANDMTFMNIIKETEAKEIHLFGIMSDYEPVELVKKVSGMLKYADKEKQGVVNLEKASSALAIPSDLFLACVELLDSASVVEINEITETNIKLKFQGSANFAEMQELDEYRNFLNVLNEFESYKIDCKSKDIGLIKETLNNCRSLLEI